MPCSPPCGWWTAGPVGCRATGAALVRTVFRPLIALGTLGVAGLSVPLGPGRPRAHLVGPDRRHQGGRRHPHEFPMGWSDPVARQRWVPPEVVPGIPSHAPATPGFVPLEDQWAGRGPAIVSAESGRHNPGADGGLASLGSTGQFLSHQSQNRGVDPRSGPTGPSSTARPAVGSAGDRGDSAGVGRPGARSRTCRFGADLRSPVCARTSRRTPPPMPPSNARWPSAPDRSPSPGTPVARCWSPGTCWSGGTRSAPGTRRSTGCWPSISTRAESPRRTWPSTSRRWGSRSPIGTRRTACGCCIPTALGSRSKRASRRRSARGSGSSSAAAGSGIGR